MALARCESCGSPRETKYRYTHPHAVISPQRLLCGAPTCVQAALLWLTDEEQQRYEQGVRVFQFSNHSAEAKVC